MATFCAIAHGLKSSAAEFAAAPPLRSDIPLTVLIHEKPDGFFPPALSGLGYRLEPAWRGVPGGHGPPIEATGSRA
jgi:hypothetical protein